MVWGLRGKKILKNCLNNIFYVRITDMNTKVESIKRKGFNEFVREKLEENE